MSEYKHDATKFYKSSKFNVMPCPQQQNLLILGYSRGIRMSNNLEIPHEINDIIYFFSGLSDKQIKQFAQEIWRSLKQLQEQLAFFVPPLCDSNVSKITRNTLNNNGTVTGAVLISHN